MNLKESLVAEIPAVDINSNSTNSVFAFDWGTQMMNVVERLPEEHRLLISLVFGIGGYEPLSEEEVAFELGLTAGDVRNVCDDALRLLRNGAGMSCSSRPLLQ